MSDPYSAKMTTTMMDARVQSGASQQIHESRKWPVWVRILIILGLSGALWTLIIGGVLYLMR